MKKMIYKQPNQVLDGTGEEACILIRVTAKILQAMHYLEDALIKISKTSDEKE